MAIDPYRVLGLPPEATVADVKRAYRRLAKANHPDSAGEGALPRFLEIQRAYETLTSPGWRPGARRPSTAASASEPWRADPRRARSTPGAQPPGSDATSRRGSGEGRGTGTGAPGARPGGPGPGRTTAGAGGTRTRPGDGAARGGSATGGAGAGASAGGTTGRRRPSKKATFGSTTYDEAREQADTTWSGASWYGPSSGEYWRVNPREYADPRKHGPEYLAKAAARAAAAAERRARRDQGDAANPGTHAEAAAGPAAQGGTQRPAPRPAAGSSAAWDDSAPPPPRPAWTAREPGVGQDSGETAPPLPRIDPYPAWRGYWQDLSPAGRRFLLALVAWPPLGIAAAAAIGEATGCAAFEATCTAPADLYPWLAQAAILLALLALPAVARVLAGGTVAVLVFAFPVAAALSASGASYDRTYGPAALIAVLGVAWAAGVAAVALRRLITRSPS